MFHIQRKKNKRTNQIQSLKAKKIFFYFYERAESAFQKKKWESVVAMKKT